MNSDSIASDSVKKFEYGDEENYGGVVTAVATPGDADVVPVATATATATSKKYIKEDGKMMMNPAYKEVVTTTTTTTAPSPPKVRQDSIHSMMRSKKESDSYDLAEDVYAFMFVCPVFSTPFLFSLYVYATKIIIYSILVGDINFEIDGGSKSATAAKFFLIPVALSMQGDLMHFLFNLANTSYSPEVLKVSTSATKPKLFFSFLLRFIDGAFSLIVNYMLMLTTETTLSVFTNFAALYFLQDIDDVFYGLVEKGFFGDGMEHWSTVCKSVTLPRRTSADNQGCGSIRISHLDSLSFLVIFIVLLVVYALYIWAMFYNFGGFNDN